MLGATGGSSASRPESPTGRPASSRSSSRPGRGGVVDYGAAAKIPFSSSNVETILKKIREFSNKNLSEDGLKNLIDDIDWVKDALISGSGNGTVFSGDFKGITSHDNSFNCMFHNSTHRQDISNNIASVLEVFNAVLKTTVDDKVIVAINHAKEAIADAIISILKGQKSDGGYAFKETRNALIITDYQYDPNVNDFVTGHIEKRVAQNNDRDTEIQYWDNFCLALKNEAKSK